MRRSHPVAPTLLEDYDAHANARCPCARRCGVASTRSRRSDSDLEARPPRLTVKGKAAVAREPGGRTSGPPAPAELDVIEYRPLLRIRNGIDPDLVSRCQPERTETAPGSGVSVGNGRRQRVIGRPCGERTAGHGQLETGGPVTFVVEQHVQVEEAGSAGMSPCRSYSGAHRFRRPRPCLARPSPTASRRLAHSR